MSAVKRQPIFFRDPEARLSININGAKQYLKLLQGFLDDLTIKFDTFENYIDYVNNGQVEEAIDLLNKRSAIANVMADVAVEISSFKTQTTVEHAQRKNYRQPIGQSVLTLQMSITKQQNSITDKSWFNAYFKEPCINFLKSIASFFGMKPVFSSQHILTEIKTELESTLLKI